MRPVNSLAVSAVRMMTETYLAAWEQVAGSAEARELKRAAGEARGVLRAFARAFSSAEPASLLCEGQEAWLSGRSEAALRAWRRCVERAEELAMPYEEGRARLELGRHLDAESPGRAAHLVRAREIFQRLEAAVDLARAEAELARVAPP